MHMMLRTPLELMRQILLGRQSGRIREMARGIADGVLRDEGTGFIVPNVVRYAAQGPSGAYSIFVAAPDAPPPVGGFPVLTLLDGNAWIGVAAEALRFQSRFPKESGIEPMMLVAVGYPGDMPFDLGRRAYDFLPRHNSGKISERFRQGAPWHQPGGDAAFLSFLTGALRRGIAARYPVDPKRQFLCGHSFGGFFALRTLFTAPQSFSRYAALSPSLWWDDGRLMREADASISGLPQDIAARLLIAVGETEAPDRPEVSKRMLDDAAMLTEKLANGPPDLQVECRVVTGENHQSLPVAMFPSVFRFMSQL